MAHASGSAADAHTNTVLAHGLRARMQAMPWAADLVLAGVLMAASSVVLLGLGEEQCVCTAVPGWAYIAVAGQTLPLAARRRWPFAVALLIAPFAVWYALAELPDPVVPFGPIVAVYTVSSLGTRLQSYLTAALVVAIISIVPSVAAGDSDVLDYTDNALVFAGAWVLGDSVRSRRALLRATEERAARAETEQTLRARHAAAEERTRIAREMHDVLAHSMSLVVIQAEAGPVVVRGDPRKAVEIFDQIARTGRHALVDLRRLLGLLHADAVTAELVPQPHVEAIPELVASAARSGMNVDFVVEGQPVDVSAGTGLTAYRIVQEGLTNAARHASAARVTVRLTYQPEALLVNVADDASQPQDALAGTHGLPGAGVGLTGLKERVEAADGFFAAGPAAGSGWELRARLPLPFSSAANR